MFNFFYQTSKALSEIATNFDVLKLLDTAQMNDSFPINSFSYFTRNTFTRRSTIKSIQW